MGCWVLSKVIPQWIKGGRQERQQRRNAFGCALETSLPALSVLGVSIPQCIGSPFRLYPKAAVKINPVPMGDFSIQGVEGVSDYH